MSKSEIFTLFLIVVAVIIAAEVMANDYGKVSDLTNQTKSSVVTQKADPKTSLVGEEKTEPKVINFEADGINPNSGIKAAAGQTTASLPESTIKFADLEEIGLKNVTLQRMPFNGILFEKIDMRDFQSIPVIFQNLLQDNVKVLAGFYEFNADSSILANEIYLLIREKASKSAGATINETNDLGEKSFYVNYSDLKNSAFLIVKVNESVYALTYEKTLHSFIKSLIQILST